MRLDNVHITGQTGAASILIHGEKIAAITGGPAAGQPTLHFEDAIAFPGLINSHDHLDFNLFPPLGNRIYQHYTEWGKDIHRQNKAAIAAVLKIPRQLRTQWGMYKNLINGVTTVVNHGSRLTPAQPPITVFQRCHCLHSVQFEKGWWWKLNRPLADRKPFVIHTGEATNEAGKREIDRLTSANIFRRTIIGVHGVAMQPQQAARFKALVWCPATNLFLLNQTAPVNLLRQHTRILFGTDSTLTAPANIWEHLRLARRLQLLTDDALLEALTTTAADTWGMGETGSLTAGKLADIVIAKANGRKAMDAFYAVNPEDILLLLHRGNIRLFDESLYAGLTANGALTQPYDRVSVNGATKYIQGPLLQLMQAIQRYYPAAAFSVTPASPVPAA